MNCVRIGIDVGGSKIEGLALGEDGSELLRRRIDTPRDDYPGTLEQIRDLVVGLEQEIQQRATVGLGIPGALSVASQRVKNANSVWLNGRPLDRDLTELLGRPLRFANDANCFALSEACDGAASDAEVVFGAILGTGTGGGIVVRGRVLTGPNSVAGEWGHNPLPWPRDEDLPGPSCYCGKRGCIETFLSGPGFQRDYREKTGETLAPADIVRSAREGNPAAQAAVDRYHNRVARSLAHVINILDPDVIVLGGGMSNVGSLYESVPRLWSGHVFSDRVDTLLRPNRHGDSSGVRGAAWLWSVPECRRFLAGEES